MKQLLLSISRNIKEGSRYSSRIVLYKSLWVLERAFQQVMDTNKLNLYFLIIDSFLVELKRQFNSKNVEIMKAIQACNPQSSSFLETIKSLYPLRQAFPTLLKLLQIALTICVTSAECECCFSALKRIKLIFDQQ